MNLQGEKTVAKIVTRLGKIKSGPEVVHVEGTWGSFSRLLAAHISRELGRGILYVCQHIDQADKAADDLTVFAAQQIESFVAWEGAEELADATDDIRSERLRVAMRLTAGKESFITTTSIQAICQPIPKPQAIEKSILALRTGEDVSPEKIAGWLVDSGFENVERIDLPGQFARRGGIIDVFAPLVCDKVEEDAGKKESSQTAQAIRIEFFGDCVESIRQIDLDSQRSSSRIKEISLVSIICGSEKSDSEMLANILPADTIIILEEPNDIQEVAEIFYARAEDNSKLYKWPDIKNAMDKFTQLYISRFGGADDENSFKVDIKSVQQYQQSSISLWTSHKEALEQLVAKAKEGNNVLIYCERSAEIKRLGEIIEQAESQIPDNLKLLDGFIDQGFVIESLNTIVISHHELFGQYTVRRRQKPIRPSAPIDTLSDLQLGDYVVHLTYGIGKYLGIKTIKDEKGTSEHLTIGYADGVKIHVSVSNIVLVQKYIGTSPKRPELSRIGSKKWIRQKEQVAKSVEDLAGELLEIQAKRQSMPGIAYNKDTAWQAEFEESFPYTETADQLSSIEQIKLDMQQPTAMDRLLCGDVGYGKTEVAMRAAFKAVDNGRQAAVLVPTTVLCVQHEKTFRERFADFPITIESLNRFKSGKKARDIIERAKKGMVDILIGTHRLLSKDVGFKDLGLLVIDEEQRFGVEHKEKLKKMRTDVDVLTMTATPIPRTLHLSMLGLRDISSLTTAPLDRRSVVTSVGAYRDDLIKKAILRELNRQGQVFFLHNRVKSIEKKAWEIRRLLSGVAENVKVDIAHGQMTTSQLEKAMINFVTGKTDVLVCTTIVESGLDIPNANTIIIDNADRFGLAELHQLRGRVGRYKHRAYAYMLLPASRSITPVAAKRLKAIEEYSHLGAGFRIALRDLEIRGAGNILGSAQSGHIQTVGYQMYCDLLAQAVKRLKGEPVEIVPTAVIDLGFTTYIPKNYIPLDRYRMDVYRKIAVAKNYDELNQTADELVDMYGPLPQEVDMLLQICRLRIAASKWLIKSIMTSGTNLIFNFEKDVTKQINELFAKAKRQVRLIDSQTVYMTLPENYFEPKTLITVLRKIFGDI